MIAPTTTGDLDVGVFDHPCCLLQACNGPGASWTWSARPRELAVGAGAGGGCAGAGGGLGRSASATLRAAADLNVDAIKEKLLDHRIPESCV